jgi:transposase
MDLTSHRATLRRLTRTDPDPRVRHRADALLLVASGLSLSETATRIGCARNSIHNWGTRFLEEGREGLIDRRRLGRPHKLDAAACTLLETALGASPLDYGYPVTVWTVADLHDVLGCHGYTVSIGTVYRTLAQMGYQYRRPRHDLHHRQDVEAVASAKQVLVELQKRGLLPGLDSALSTWMNDLSPPGKSLATTGRPDEGSRRRPDTPGSVRRAGLRVWAGGV